jgi:hypothetical protein
MRSVRVRLAGGLGNQLFQYSAGFLLASSTNRVLILDDRLIKFEKAYKSRKGLGFQQLGLRGLIDEKFFLKESFLNGSEKISRSKDKILTRINLIENRNYFGNEIGNNLNLNNFIISDSNKKKVLVQGNLQSAELATAAKKMGFTSLFTKMEFGKTHKDNPIVVHVRLSDYRVPSADKYMVGPEYYKSGLSSLGPKFEDNPIWIFSDEPENAISYIPRNLRDRITFINNPKETSDVGELCLMSQGAAYVNTNSTFSFWAAFLSNSDKIIAPTPWFKGSAMNPKITLFEYPKNWISQAW